METDQWEIHADDVIARLAELGLSVRCPTDGWKLDPSEGHETMRCPGGPVQLSDVAGTLDIRVARTTGDDSVWATHIVVTATGESAEWARRVLSMLRDQRNSEGIRSYTTKIVDGQKIYVIDGDSDLDPATPYQVGGGVSAAVHDETGEPARLELWRRPERGLPL